MPESTIPQYEYYIGTYSTDFTLAMPHTQSTAYGVETIPAGTIRLKPWKLRHVKSIQETQSTMLTSKLGIPDKPAECAYVFDVGGPIRTFTISGERYDSEEEVSNLDFIFTQFNKQTINSTEYYPFTGIAIGGTYYSVGLEWLTSTMQATLKGYVYRVVSSTGETDDRTPVEQFSDATFGEEFNVGITNISFEMSSENPGLMTYTITAVARREYPGGECYREYNAGFTKV